MVIAIETATVIDANNARTVQNTNNPGNPSVVYNGVPLPVPAPSIYMVDDGNVDVVGGTRQVRAGSLMVSINGPDATIIETTKPVVLL
ncbi:MAG: hypothetical protein ACKOAG_07370 [Candidatus Kapaibacterium sp.]